MARSVAFALMQDATATEIVRKWEPVAARADDQIRNLFVAMRDDVASVLRDLIADGARVMPTGPVTLAILAGEAILDLTIFEESQRIEVEMWPTSTSAIETTMVEEQVGSKRRRTWTFRQGDKRAITIAHQRTPHAFPDEQERQGFAFQLARRAGWPMPDGRPAP
jgi:hypothetical protein